MLLCIDHCKIKTLLKRFKGLFLFSMCAFWARVSSEVLELDTLPPAFPVLH